MECQHPVLSYHKGDDRTPRYWVCLICGNVEFEGTFRQALARRQERERTIRAYVKAGWQQHDAGDGSLSFSKEAPVVQIRSGGRVMKRPWGWRLWEGLRVAFDFVLGCITCLIDPFDFDA